MKGVTQTIPKNAKLVFKSEVFKIYRWRQRMFDGSYQLFEKVICPDAVQVIATLEKRIILVRERQPSVSKAYVSLPGGVINANETPLHAAKRELLEETGYTSDNWRLFSVEGSTTKKIAWDLYWYIAKDCRKAGEPRLDSGEEIEVITVNLDRFLKEITERLRNSVSYLAEIKYDKRKRTAFYKKLFR